MKSVSFKSKKPKRMASAKNKRKFIIYVDGDNVQTAGLSGVERLDADDEVRIFYNANSKVFSAEKKAGITADPKCSIVFQMVPATANSVDFAIAVEAAKRFAEEKDAENMYILVSRDKHFETIARELHRIFSIKKVFYCTGSIDEAITKYGLMKIEDADHLRKYLFASFGKIRGQAVWESLKDIFRVQEGKNGGKRKLLLPR